MISNKKDVKRLESEVYHTQESMNNLSKNDFNNNIKDAWQRLKTNKGQEDLKTIPIDTISTLEKGMPINLLTDNGFRSLYDIRNHSYADLMKVDGTMLEILGYSIYMPENLMLLPSHYKKTRKGKKNR